MDEPTSSLDEREVAVLFDVMRRLRAEGVAVIFVGHRLDELYRICDRVTVMRDGRTIMVSRMADIGKLNLIAAMLGRDLETVRAHSTGFSAARAAAGKVVLSAKGLRIGRKVRDARVEVRERQIVGLAGLLGSGRTEVARAIFGADPPDAGTIEMSGRPVSPQEPADAIALGVGYCSEDRKADGIIPDMSVRENMTLGILPRLTSMGIVDEARQREIVDKFMKRLAIKASSAEQKIRELSGGNQQKVLLARWLCTNPKLLILDEPTRGIDVGAKAEIQALIRELADQGLGVLMISSELEEITEGADRVFVLSDGRTVADVSHAEASAGAIIAAMAHSDAEALAEAGHG
jgi:galactofuranose transport system ATP-binding protein